MREPSHECPITPSRTRAHGHESHHHGVISMLVTHGLQPACLLTSLGAPASTGSPLSGSMPRSGFLRENIKFCQVLRGRLEIGRRAGLPEERIRCHCSRCIGSGLQGRKGSELEPERIKMQSGLTEMGTSGDDSFATKSVFFTSSAVSSRSTADPGFSSRTCDTHNTQRPATDDPPSEALDQSVKRVPWLVSW